MSSNLREAILAADDLDRQAVEVDGWDFPVYVRVISGRERQLMVEKHEGLEGNDAAMQELLPFVAALCLVDADGKQPFDPSEPADLELLAGKGAKQLEQVFEAAMTVNGLSADAIEDIAGN